MTFDLLSLDAALQRLAPSLASYRGCTIIDINPGAALWSSKLHQYLKPRSHILVEPRRKLYLPWLMPLVEAPESCYHLRDWDEPSLWNPTQYIREGLLPDDLGNPNQKNTCNNALLIVANLTSHFRKNRKPVELATNMFHRMSEVRNKEGFHANGAVRMLVWIPENIRSALLPKTVPCRTRLSLQMEMVFHIEEVIQGGATVRAGVSKRPEILDIESTIRVLREMNKKNIHFPDLRRSDVHKRAQELIQDSSGVKLSESTGSLKQSTATPRGWHRELEKLEKDFHDGQFSKFIDGSIDTEPGSDVPKAMPDQSRPSTKYNRLVELQRNLRWHQKNERIIDELFQEQKVIDSLEHDTWRSDLDALEREACIQRVKSLSERLKTRLEQLSARIRMQYVHHRDEQKGLALDPPLLMWDRRNVEPLTAYTDEVHPKASFSLLDFQPRSSNPYPMTGSQVFLFDLITRMLFQNTHQGVSILDAMAPGASNAIVPKVPSLRDVRRGGCRDLSSLQNNMLTREMVHGIILAWDGWPFKPTFGQILLKDV